MQPNVVYPFLANPARVQLDDEPVCPVRAGTTVATGSTVNKALLWLLWASMTVLPGCHDKSVPPQKVQTVKPALSVSAVRPQEIDWPLSFTAGGSVAAWQEAIISPEISNFRITAVLAGVGDRVRKGDVLARIASDTVDSELAETRAAVAEAAATLAEARANHERARQLRERGFYSAQQEVQSRTLAETAAARLNAARARLRSAELRSSKAVVVAPDEGIISARAATVGSLTQSGQDLFRLIRGGRLEWRAEVTAGEIGRCQAGMSVILETPRGSEIPGVVRAVAPAIDPQTRIGLVYVDLPSAAVRLLSAGMFTRGRFEVGRRPALTLPQSAVQLREGFAYVFRLESVASGGAPADTNLRTVAQTKVATGRRMGDRIEITSGLDPAAQVVAGGVAFLADGDTVRVVEAGQRS